MTRNTKKILKVVIVGALVFIFRAPLMAMFERLKAMAMPAKK